MRIAVTGAGGLLGAELVPRLAAAGHTVITGSRKQPPGTIHQAPGNIPVTELRIALTVADSIRRFLEDARAECVIHAAALTDVDRCEREPALATVLNSAATGQLAIQAGRTATRIIYISTDYVFNGHDGPYYEPDRPDPINVYGRTKLAGEEAVLSAGDQHTVIRTASLISGYARNRRCFLDTMCERMQYLPPLRAPCDQLANVTPVWYLADAILAIAERSLGGIWHVAGREVLSRYELACRVARLYELPPTSVERVSFRDLQRDAPRPLRGGLVTRKAQVSLPVAIPTLQQSLEEWKYRKDAGGENR